MTGDNTKKRKPVDEDAGPSKKKGDSKPAGQLVNPKRVRELKGGDVKAGPVVYWLSRDQRVNDNWALLYAIEQAQKSGSPVAVAFNLVRPMLCMGIACSA